MHIHSILYRGSTLILDSLDHSQELKGILDKSNEYIDQWNNKYSGYDVNGMRFESKS